MATAHDIRYTADAAVSHTSMYAFDRPFDQARGVNCDSRTSTSNQSSVRRAEPRLPTPTFALPASLSSTCAPTVRTRRRPMSMADIQQSCPLSTSPASDPGGGIGNRTVTLPRFSFNPGASIPSDPQFTVALSSPPVSPNSARPLPSPSRPAGHGHRRGGSEFVGGSIRDGSSIAIAVMSTSPTRSESGLASLGLKPPPPPRGHRRGLSGTVPVNDLPFLYPQPDFLLQKGSSAPNSPTTFSLHDSALLPLDDQPGSTLSLPPLAVNIPIKDLNGMEEDIVNNDRVPVPTLPSKQELSPAQVKSARARVGFSDTLEFIPRPLSLVSNDTSSTVTARLGHTVSGSITSIVSATSPVDRGSPAPLARTPTHDTVDSRPSTAGAILERTATDFHPVATGKSAKRRRNSISTLLSNATSDPPKASNSSPTKMLKRWSFFSLEPFFGSSPTSKQQRLCGSSSSESMSKSTTLVGSLSEQESDSSGDEETAVSDANDSAKKERKRPSRKKRVKGWAGAILPLRGNKKQSKMPAVRPPTPPASVGVVEDDEDEDDTDVIDTASGTESSFITPTVLITEARPLEDDSVSPKQRSDEDGGCPMIDLDAALGPFNTPLPRNAEWEAAQGAAGLAGKRKLHSAQGMKGFIGPGMHYHRRAESAPNLPPFDSGRTGIHKYGSSSTMADVFEEDEEDDGEARSAQANLESKYLVHEVMRDDADDVDDVDEADDANDVVAETTLPVTTETSAFEPSFVNEGMVGSTTTSEVIDSLGGLSIDQSNSVPSSPRLLPSHREAAAIDPSQPLSLNDATVVSFGPFSTKHASTSNASIDAQRSPMAPSVLSDRLSYHSLLISGEPGPEVRMSGDCDISSLMSSASTTTRESAFVPTTRMSQPSLFAERPVSVSSAAFGRRRSSLVSLSRLISSAHGERSKLSMEVSVDGDGGARRSRSKNSKSKRLGRMMQFWKPSKDSSPT
ncbi:hypothetical protein E4U09_001154 [Claviceps aff. purpurea]|uniref:Cell wall proline rich protein n=1 Tax=Claviceps aff. purpurea TaxID=1967640 RepID=A0A9P7QNB7_9HYPO|nr:hypothetical protein E4U09_001154 [Claviceps aff. purpurea]